MDWSGKRVAINSSNAALPWLINRLEEKGALVENNKDNADIVIVPMLNRLEYKAYGNENDSVIPFPVVVRDLLDSDFKPAWFSSITCKPTVFTSIVLPDYTKTKAYMLDNSDIEYNNLADMAEYWGIPVYQTEADLKGTLLVVMPNKCHQFNIDYIKHWIDIRTERNNVSFITMAQLKVSIREWKIKHPNYVPKSPPDVEFQNMIFNNKWEMVKAECVEPWRDFSHGIYRDYVVIDTEYRNVSPYIPYSVVCEIGAVKVRNGQIVDSFAMYVSNDIFNIYGLTKYRFKIDEIRNNIDSIDKVIPALKEFIGNDVIVGHSIKTDMLILALNGNCKFENNCIDTLGLIVNEYPYRLSSFGLPKIAEELGLYKNSHWAIDDAVTTYEFYEHIVETVLNGNKGMC